MRVKTEDTFRCDGCGKEQVNPNGWSYIDPRRSGSCDFRSDRLDICSECYYAIRDLLKSRAVGQFRQEGDK